MAEKLDRMDAINELLRLGNEAQRLLDQIEETRNAATSSQLAGWISQAGELNLDAALLDSRLEEIGNRQSELIDQLEAMGEIIYLE